MQSSRWIRGMLAALFLLTPLMVSFAGAQESASATSPDSSSASDFGRADAPAIFIGPGDMLSINVFETPELTTSLRVSQTGDINLPVLGRVHVAGLTAQGAAVEIQDELKEKGLLIDPHVTVSTTEFASQGATVLGEVRTPGVYPTLGSRRLLDMLALAGGVSNTAGRLVTIVHRGDPEHPVHIALQPTPAAMREQKNPVILPGDTVDVAKAGVIYIMGDVLRPGGILVDNNERLSVIEALSLAGGIDKTAAMSKTQLIRKLPAGREEVDLDLKKILYGKQADVLVSDGDILYVPTSTGKTLIYRGTEALFGIGTELAYYLH
jgi:polysaccharide export outer membrane protein